MWRGTWGIEWGARGDSDRTPSVSEGMQPNPNCPRGDKTTAQGHLSLRRCFVICASRQFVAPASLMNSLRALVKSLAGRAPSMIRPVPL
jgi:hypothetical protein